MKQNLGNYPSTLGKLFSISTPISRTFLQRAGTVASQYSIFSINTIFKEKWAIWITESQEREIHIVSTLQATVAWYFFPFLSLGIPPNIPRPVSHLHRSSERHRGTSKIYEAFISHRIFIQNTSWHLCTEQGLIPCDTWKIQLEVRRILWVDPSASCSVCKSKYGPQIPKVCEWSYSNCNHGNRPEIPRIVFGDWYRACETMDSSRKNLKIQHPHQAVAKRKFSWTFQWELRGKIVEVGKDLIFISGTAGTEMGAQH